MTTGRSEIYQQPIIFHDGTPVPTIMVTADVVKFFRIRGKTPIRSVNRLCNEHGLKYFTVAGHHRRFLLDDVLEFVRNNKRVQQ